MKVFSTAMSAIAAALAGIMLFLPFGADGTECAKPAEIKSMFHSDNSLQRKEAIHQAAICGELWVAQMLETALDDKSPVVVEAAVQEIGNLRLISLAPRLITLYTQSDSRFAGYAERVKFALIPSLGKLGGETVTGFLKRELEHDNGTELGEAILSAVRLSGDAALIDDVRDYAYKMDQYIANAQAKNLDPIVYSLKLHNSSLAHEIENVLMQKGGHK